MAYSELIKNFEKVRGYMREFYLYGFKNRDDFNEKSLRSYDDERRRIESWLGEYMKFSRNDDGKNVFISIDSREINHNPLYTAWKSKSFTDGDISLHFIIFDILHSSEIKLTSTQIYNKIENDYLSAFENARFYDESTIRKKLNEYTKEGLLIKEKCSKAVTYKRSADLLEILEYDALDFFSETAPCGVIGSFLLDKYESHNSIFAFKHHYITGTLDSDIMCELFNAMRERRFVTVDLIGKRQQKPHRIKIAPLKIFISVQSGRQYILAWNEKAQAILSYRLDSLSKIQLEETCTRFDAYRAKLNRMQKHMWGVNCNKKELKLEHIEFTIYFNDNENFIVNRLEREKRCGKVNLIDSNTARFSADVYDPSEMIPWIRTFICRIKSLSCTDKNLENEIRSSITEMYTMYGIGGESK